LQSNTDWNQGEDEKYKRREKLYHDEGGGKKGR